MNAQSLSDIAKTLMLLSTGMISVGAYVGFIADDTFTLHAQVAAHISTLLGAVALKLSYVMHLNACKHLGINEFSRQQSGEPQLKVAASENYVHECCLTGMHRL